MTAPGLVEADIPGMREVAGVLDLIGEDVAGIATTIYEVPVPALAAYGWQCVVDGMDELLRSWSAEVELLRQVCGAMSRSVARAADDLERVDSLAGDELAVILPGR